MYPNPWATSVPPPATKPAANNYENNTQSYPFYAAQNVLQNISQMNQQSSLTLNTSSIMNNSLQPNAIDPAMVQKWQEWKQWELWQQQYQQWQQQTGQITPATTQVPPPIPSSQALQPSQTPTIPFQNQQFLYNQPVPPLPLSNPPPQNQQNDIKSEVGMKRGLEAEFQSNEKKIKVDTSNNKKEIELNDETEALFEEQFKSWEAQFIKWKEQNKNHPDKTQYLEYEKKWLNWRDHLKQKCEVLKKKRELKMAEKKKETIQAEENKLQAQQKLSYNPMMMTNINTYTNEPPPSTLQYLHNNNSSIISTPENQIPGLDLVSNNNNTTKGYLNVARILPQVQNGLIQTPDDKPFNFPKNITNISTINQHSNIPAHNNMIQPSSSIYQNSSNWSNNNYNNPVLYNNQKPSDVNNSSESVFSQQTDTDFRQSFGGNTSNIVYKNSSHNTPSMNFRGPIDGSFNKPSSETNTVYNKPSDNQLYNRNLNTSTNHFHDFNQSNTSTFNNFNRQPEKSNTPYQQSMPSLNMTPSKLPSLLSLNVVKPPILDKPGNYLENKNVAPNSRYERNWNIDEDDDPENDYMEAHKKFSSEPYNDQNNEDQFSNKQYRNTYNENRFSRGQQEAKNNFNDDYSRPLNHSRRSIIRNTDNEFCRPNSKFSRNIGQNYSRDIHTLKNSDDGYYHSQNMNINQGFPKGQTSLSKDGNGEYSDEPLISKNNFVSQKKNYGQSSRGNYRSPSRGNYESSMENFSNNPINTKNIEWDNDYAENEGHLNSVKDTLITPPIIKPPHEIPPIDPIKIFDYRHLPTLKVIPGLIKETVIPIRIYDHKHGGKRILPWQDRGYSRRNLNHTRDLNEKEDSNQNIKTDDFDKTKDETLNAKPTFSFIDISSDEKDRDIDKNQTVEIIEDVESPSIDTITIIDDNEKNERQLPIIESVKVCAPSPPKMSIIKEVKRSAPRQLLTIETLLCPPGRFNRPSKIVIILRGLPGSGKSHIARLIKEKEVAMGGQAPRILSLDDYFMTEVTKTEIDPETNKKIEIKEMEYEHDSANESLYRTSFIKAFKKKISENYFSFFIIDAINNKVSYYKDIVDISKINGFTVYIIELESDVDLCIKRNIHNRTVHDINSIMRSWNKTPDDQILLDIHSLLHSPSQIEVNMEDVSDVEMELDKDEVTADINKSEDDKNIEFEEEKKLIEQYLGPGAFTDRRWLNKVVLNITENVSGTS